jgi:hypothetical protein
LVTYRGALEYAATAATRILVVTPPTATAGTAFDVTLRAVDQYDNPVLNYTGTVALFTLPGMGTVPAAYTFTPADGGTHTFTGGATLTSTGVQAIFAVDFASSLFGQAVLTVVAPST